jgi:hypothetical protein
MISGGNLECDAAKQFWLPIGVKNRVLFGGENHRSVLKSLLESWLLQIVLHQQSVLSNRSLEGVLRR